MAIVQTLCPVCGTMNRVDQLRLADSPRCGRCHGPLFQRLPQEADDSVFERLLKNEQLPLVVDFWAAWCGPCKIMVPVFAQAAGVFEPRARFLKVDTEKAQRSAARFNIRSIPTLMIFHHGEKIAEQAGAMNQGQLKAWLEHHLP